jgi:hypothetical protein
MYQDGFICKIHLSFAKVNLRKKKVDPERTQKNASKPGQQSVIP